MTSLHAPVHTGDWLEFLSDHHIVLREKKLTKIPRSKIIRNLWRAVHKNQFTGIKIRAKARLIYDIDE